MALFLKLLWDYRKVVLWVVLLVTLALLAWRVSVWHKSHQELGRVKEQLAAELSCDLSSECHKRAATLAEQARQEAALKAQDALQAAERAEAKARAEASAWRKRYEAALRDDPDCADWASHKIACPL